MTALPKHRMSVDEFLAWADSQDGRWELYRGVPYLMAPERTRHGEVKFAVQTALVQAIRKAGLPCHMLPDGATVRVSEETAHEPDALVYCGPKLPGDSVEVPSPVIVVEVSSPSTRRVDTSVKLAGYFSLPSVQHYVIVDPDGPPIIHHAGNPDGTLLTRLTAAGSLRLDPPGLAFSVEDVLGL